MQFKHKKRMLDDQTCTNDFSKFSQMHLQLSLLKNNNNILYTNIQNIPRIRVSMHFVQKIQNKYLGIK